MSSVSAPQLIFANTLIRLIFFFPEYRMYFNIRCWKRRKEERKVMRIMGLFICFSCDYFCVLSRYSRLFLWLNLTDLHYYTLFLEYFCVLYQCRRVKCHCMVVLVRVIAYVYLINCLFEPFGVFVSSYKLLSCTINIRNVTIHVIIVFNIWNIVIVMN